MNQNNKSIINEYKNYLIKSKANTIKINMNIKSVNDIKEFEKISKENLSKLEDLSKEYKLYDKDYDDFRMVMGKLALGLSKSHKLMLSDKDKKRLTAEFLNLHEQFEDLMQRNIVKDAYVWK